VVEAEIEVEAVPWWITDGRRAGEEDALEIESSFFGEPPEGMGRRGVTFGEMLLVEAGEEVVIGTCTEYRFGDPIWNRGTGCIPECGLEVTLAAASETDSIVGTFGEPS
jgi:hypothetical protein